MLRAQITVSGVYTDEKLLSRLAWGYALFGDRWERRIILTPSCVAGRLTLLRFFVCI